MVVDTTTDNLCVNKIVGQKSDTIFIEGDVIVPDIKPDILNTINTSGVVFVYKKEILDGKIRLDGSVNSYIMYLADTDNSNIRGLNTTLDFTQIIDFKDVKPGMSLEENIIIKEITCRVLNGRKVNIKVALEINLKVYSNENIELIKQVNDILDVQTLNDSINIKSLIGEGNSKIYAKDTLNIDNIDDLMEILNVDFRIVNKDTKISYNKVLVKADMELKIMYLTEDDRINIVEGIIPAMGFIELQNISDENLCDMSYVLKNLIIKPNNTEEHSIYIEAEIEVGCRAYENKQIDIIQDLYSPQENLKFTVKNIQVITGKEKINDLCSIREKQSIAEIGTNRIYDVKVKPIITNQNILNDKIIFEGEINLNYLFSSDNGVGVDTKQITTPFNHTINITKLNSKSNINTAIDVGMQNFVITSEGSIDVKIDLNFDIEISETERLKVINEIELEENNSDDNYSMIIYFVKPGDTLWKIAKKFRSTVQDIARINGIEDVDKLEIGKQLFIPRYIARRVAV